jgi:hypothetical protein
MYGHPKNRAAFQSECATDRQNVLHPFRRLIASMGKEPMVAHSDSHTPGNPPQDHRDQESFPGEEEQRCNRSDMKCRNEEGRHPNDGLRKRSIGPKTSRHMQDFLYLIGRERGDVRIVKRGNTSVSVAVFQRLGRISPVTVWAAEEALGVN